MHFNREWDPQRFGTHRTDAAHSAYGGLPQVASTLPRSSYGTTSQPCSRAVQPRRVASHVRWKIGDRRGFLVGDVRRRL
jgi:hypothetical protein